MKNAVLLIVAVALLVASLWLFARCGDFFAAKSYLAGLLYMFVGFAVVRAGVELARLSVVYRGGRQVP